ncbi:MAG: oligosaccharide flippase family protein [Caulobacteraceae bacterium]
MSEDGSREHRPRIIITSALWRLFEIAGAEVLSFGFMVLLARLLSPEDYGLVASAALFVVSCQTLLMRGIPDAIIQADVIPDALLDTAFWINLGIGCALSLALIALAAPSAALLGQPDLRNVMFGLAPLPPLFAAIGIYHAQLRREMKFRKLALRTHAAVFSGGAVGVALALSGGGFWSLVCQQLSYTAVNLLVIAFATGWRPRMRFEAEAARSVRGFGSTVSAAAFLDTLSHGGLAFIVGLRQPAAMVGMFFMARRVVFSLSMFTHWSVNELSLPVLSRVARAPERHREAVYMCLKLASLITVPAFAGVAVFADRIVPLAFGPDWAASTGALQVLLLAGILQAVPSVASQVFASVGQPHHTLQINIVTSVLTVVLVVLVGLLAGYGIAAAATGVLIAYAVAAPLALLRLRSSVQLSLLRLGREQAPIWLGIGALSLAVAAIDRILPADLSLVAVLVAELGIWALGVALIVYLALPQGRSWIAAFLSRSGGGL